MLLPTGLTDVGEFRHLSSTPPPPELQQQPPESYSASKLFIGGLSYDSTDASLAGYFEQYGAVLSATVLRDPVTAHSRGFGFVTFVSELSAQRVLAHSRTHLVDGRKVEAKVAVPRNQARKDVSPPNPNPYLNHRGVQNYMQNPMNFQPMRMLYDYDYQAQQPPMFANGLGGETYDNFGLSTAPEGYQQQYADSRPAVEKTISFADSRRRPTHPKPTQPLPSPRKMRNFSMPPSALGLESLSLQEEGQKAQVFVEEIPPDASEEELGQIFRPFGAQRIELAVGFAVLHFGDAIDADRLLAFERSQGSLSLRGYALKLKNFGNVDTFPEDEYLERTMMRSNSLPMDRPPQLMRANSVFEDRRSTLLREDKMRSFSFTQQLGQPRKALFTDDTTSVRRSSSFENGGSPLTK